MRKNRMKKPLVAVEAPKPEITDAKPDTSSHILAAFSDCNEREVAFLRTCLEMHREDRGCDTPMEDFLDWLVTARQLGQYWTLDDAEAQCETFLSNVESFWEIARRAYKFNPDACRGEAA